VATLNYGDALLHEVADFGVMPPMKYWELSLTSSVLLIGNRVFSAIRKHGSQ
jgi:hypothetical protein